MDINDANKKKEIDEIAKENEKIKNELIELKKKPTGNIAYILLTIGMILFAISIVHNMTIPTYIGIALLLWGTLFLYVKPINFIRKDILNSIIPDINNTLENLIRQLEYRGVPKYISPGTFSGLSNVVIYITKSPDDTLPTELPSENTIINKKPPSMTIKPPGLGLSKLIEKELRTNFSAVDYNYLNKNLEKALVERLEIARSFEIEKTNSSVTTRIKKGIFDVTVSSTSQKENIILLGDPLTSAIACILARVTRKPITIESIEKEEEEIITNYKIND